MKMIPVDLRVGKEVSNVSFAGGAGLDYLLHPEGPASTSPSVHCLPLPLHHSPRLILCKVYVLEDM